MIGTNRTPLVTLCANPRWIVIAHDNPLAAYRKQFDAD